jgi:hypothetical protein
MHTPERLEERPRPMEITEWFFLAAIGVVALVLIATA